MRHIRKIDKAESTSSSDPEYIANREPYTKLIELGEQIIPYLVERSYIWNIGLKKITGIEPDGNNSSEIMNFWKKWAIDNGYTK